MANKLSRPGESSTQTSDDPSFAQPSKPAAEQFLAELKAPLFSLLSSHDFEQVASKTLSKKAWAFYSSAATDLVTLKANKSTFDRIWWRPRILRDVKKVSTQTKMLGCNTKLPLFVSPTAMAKLVHPEGEKGIAKGCVNAGVPQCIATNASFSVSKVIASAPPGHPFFFQVYVNPNRSKTEALIREAKELGVRGIFVTVDAPVPGKREADERVKADETLSGPMSGEVAKNDKKGGGLGRIMAKHVDSALTWEDIRWVKEVSGGLPIVLKGIQGAADAKLAVEYGVDGIVLSNHGGRSLDTSPPAILVLLELQKCCPEVFDHLEVYVDGGIRRGTDILKALCLGATAVGMGRPFLYALNYGKEGVEHLIEIMKDELETSMRIVGITDISQCHPGLINTLDIDYLVPQSLDHPYALWRRKAKL